MSEKVKKPVIFVFSPAYLPFIGGAEVAIEQVAKRLGDKYDFFIFTSRMRRDLPKREVRSEGVVVRVGLGTRFDKFLLLIFGPFCAWRLARSFDPAPDRMIWWAMDFSFGAGVAGILKIFYQKIPLIFTIQYGYGDERVAKGRLGLMNSAFRLILLQSDYVTAISNSLLNLCGQYGYIGEEAVIHNGVDLEKFSEKRKENKKISNTIITVSRLVPKNGVDVLIKAIAELKKDIPNIELRIIGDGPERKNLERMAYGLGLKADIKFFGEISYDDLPQHFAEADIFARPSRSEGMGNAFIEALAAGIPIVGTPVGGILDIIEDGETGLFTKVDDPKDLTEKIKILLENKELSAKIVANGKKMVEERFSWDKISRNYADVFNHELNLKKRILIATGIFPPEVGGPATYSKILLDELPKHDFGVRVLSFGSVRRLPKILRHIAYGLKVFCMGRNADIVFAQDPVSVGLPAALAAKILGKKFLLKIVGDYAWEQGVQRFGVKEALDDFLKNKYRWEVEILRKIQKFAANRAEKIIVPSEYLRGVVTAWDVKQEKIHVVYNAFDFEGAGHQLRRPTSKLVVSAGRLVPWKGFGVLIEIMTEILKEIPEAKLVIIGGGPEFENCKLKIENLGMQKHISLLGNLSHTKVLEYLQATDLFVLNTAYEGFSHQILEAMASGVPVVTTDAGGNPELIEDGESGFLVKFNDKNALKSKILDVLSNPILAQKFSENAKKKAQEFSKERMIGDTMKTISSL